MDALLAGTPVVRSVEESYDLCQKLATTHYENFTVGSWFLPRGKRKHFYAIYAFCRSVDDLGDEYPGDRMGALDMWEQEVRSCFRDTPKHPYMIALQDTIKVCDIPEEPFLKLIKANRMDQTNARYPTYEDLEFYCQHSANPVGHLVLYACGYRDAERQRLSDYTCTALQLANFWQDVRRDFDLGRIYIPLEDMARFGYSEEELASRTVTQEFRKLMAFEVGRARDLFRLGFKLVHTLQGRIKLDVALFGLGGMKVMDAIERQNYDVLSRRPTLSKATKFRLMLSTMLKLRLLGKV